MHFVQSSIMGISATLAMSSLSAKLPNEIIGNGQWIIADMDGTLIGNPSYKKEPTLDESSAKDEILDWLRQGGSLLVVTGNEKIRSIERLTQGIPPDLREALLAKRLLISTNGGALISYYDGVRWTEDTTFQFEALSSPIAIQNPTLIVDKAVTLINNFYQEIRDNKIELPEHLQKKYPVIFKIAKEHPQNFTLEELETLNSDIVPRIEVRRSDNNSVVQIAIVGIPGEFDYKVAEKFDLAAFGNLGLDRVGLTHEISVKGVDKALPILWLQQQREGYPKFDKDQSVGIGDRPNHNDLPLTKVVGAFVSVCEYDKPDYIPSHVSLRLGENQLGTKKLIRALLTKAKEFEIKKRYEPVIVCALSEAVENAKENK